MCGVCYFYYFISLQYLKFEVNNDYVICKRFLHGVHLDVIRKLEKCTVMPSLRNFDGKKLYLNQLNLKKVLFYISVHFLARDNYLGKVLRILCASE